MNKHAQAQALVFMLAIVVIILGLSFAGVLNKQTVIAMNETGSHAGTDIEGNAGTIEEIGMQCSNSSISDFQKAGCWVVDIGAAYFIGGIFALAGAIIAARIIFE